MGLRFNPLSNTFDFTGSGGGGGSSYIDGEVQNFSALPETLGTPPVDSAYLVREAEGTWLLNRKPAGIYIRTANTGTRADDWTHAGAFPDVFSDANFVLYDETDSTKNLAFQLSGLTTGTTRTLTAPDASGTIALTSDIPAGLADGDKGDITVSGSGATWTIDAGVVETSNLGGDITTAGKALLDDADAAAQRTTLGLGTAATLDTGTTAGTVAAGDDSRFADIPDPSSATPQALGSASAGTSDDYSRADHIHAAPALNDLSNVSAAAPSDNDVLVYDNATSTWVAEAPAGGTDNYSVKTTTYTAVNGDRIAADTTGGAFTITLPATPANGDTVYFFDYADTFDTNNLTLGRNGSNIEGLAEDMVCNVEGSAFSMIYAGATNGWQMVPYYGTGLAVGTSATDILSVSSGTINADDAGADRIVFWDDSESKLAYLEAGSGLSISGTTITATASGGSKTYAVFTPDNNQPPASNYATLDTRNSVACLDFDDATDESAVFVGIIPEGASLGSGLKIRIHWAATTATSGDCVWLAALERMNTDLDSDSFDTAGTVTTACNGTSGIVAVSEITLTNIDSVTAGDGFRLKITRDADSGSDTLSGDVELVLTEVRSAA